MARIRSIKPEFCSSEAIARLSIPCRLHFAMLWTYADDEGRGLDNPRLVKAALWPLDDEITAAQVEEWQSELEANGRITRYEAGGRRYFAIANFTEHQRPSKPNPSKFPEPPPQGGGGLPEDSRNGSGAVPESSNTGPKDDGNPPGGLLAVVGGEGSSRGKENARSDKPSNALTEAASPTSSAAAPLTALPARLAVVPDAQAPKPSTPGLALMQRPGEPTLPASADAPPQDTWGCFWRDWPRKVRKQQARQAWNRLRGSGVSDMEILAGLEIWNAHWQADATPQRYIPHPDRWLRERQWQDQPPPPAERRTSRSDANARARADVVATYARAVGDDPGVIP